MKKKADEKLIAKIQKLFALGESPNMNEAAAALNKARALMDEYDLSYGEVNYINNKMKRNGKKIYEWQMVIFCAVCYANNCVSASNKNRDYGRFSIYGREINVFLSKEMFRYLVDAVMRAAKNECKGKGHKYNNDFKMAAARTLHKRLLEYGSAVSWAVDREKELKDISEYVQLKEDKKAAGQDYQFEDNRAILAGVKAANNIGLHKQAGLNETKFIGA